MRRAIRQVCAIPPASRCGEQEQIIRSRWNELKPLPNLHIRPSRCVVVHLGASLAPTKFVYSPAPLRVAGTLGKFSICSR